MSQVSSSRVVAVFGGSGFVGRHVVHALAQAGWRVKVATRSPHLAVHLLPLGTPGQIALLKANVLDSSAVSSVLQGAEAAVYLPGLLYPSGKSQTFRSIHVTAPYKIAQIAAQMGLKTFIHMSALGANIKSESVYARTKAEGEEQVFNAFHRTHVLRPSLIFGPEDRIFNFFAEMALVSPFLPLIGGGKTRFQPVFVGDVAKAVVALLDHSHHHQQAALLPTIWELGGPETLTFKDILSRVLEFIGRRRFLLPIPRALALLQASVLECFPRPLLTRDQIKLLASDSIVSLSANHERRTLQGLEINPVFISEVVPYYLARYRKKGQFFRE